MATDTVAAPAPITLEEFLELERNAPEDVELEVIRGELREYPNTTTRHRKHGITMARFSHVLLNWLDEHPDRVGVVADGEVRCHIIREPLTITGLDVAYFEGTEHVEPEGDPPCFDGPPVLAVEVLSPSDTHEKVTERVRLLLSAGVRQVWVADPDFRTIAVHRPEAELTVYTENEELQGDPELPGLKCRVGRLFSGKR